MSRPSAHETGVERIFPGVQGRLVRRGHLKDSVNQTWTAGQILKGWTTGRENPVVGFCVYRLGRGPLCQYG